MRLVDHLARGVEEEEAVEDVADPVLQWFEQLRQFDLTGDVLFLLALVVRHYVEIEQQAVVGAGGIAMLAIGGQFRRQRAGRFGPRDGSEDLGWQALLVGQLRLELVEGDQVIGLLRGGGTVAVRLLRLLERGGASDDGRAGFDRASDLLRGARHEPRVTAGVVLRLFLQEKVVAAAARDDGDEQESNRRAKAVERRLARG